METILWLLSWIYINFPLCHLNKARIPVGIKIFATPSFYDREKSRREVAPQRFHFQSKSASHAEVAPLCFYFRIHFPFSRYRRGQRSRHVLFSPLKRQEHARIAGIRPTQHRHLSPVLFLTRVLPVPLSRRDNVMVLCKKLSKFYEPPLKSFEFFHQVYINLPLSRNINKRKYRKPSKTVK